jgi:class 3 adenylate cyclase
MGCPACGFENASGIKFCGECGASLKAKCPSCGFENAPKIKFCGECGKPLSQVATESAQRDPRSYTPKHLAEKILTSRSALEGERKQVTVLFADVKGSMDLAGQVDPEEWHKIMDRFFAILSEGVHRVEGTINQYTGDGIMALFGAPIAHEDHAQRACYATLHLQQELQRYADEMRLEHGLNFSVRMGLNSGEVVVGKIGDDLRMDYTAQGQTVGLAARMEQIAEPGKALLTEHTARLVSGYFSLRDLGDTRIKGLSEPLHIFELEGAGRVRTRLDMSRARGFTRFVGRGSEMAVLEAALERAVAGNGQVLGVVADPGLGKSRLCLEFVERCQARGIFVNEAHCPPHGGTVPYLPVIELWRSYFGISGEDGGAEARRKIAGTLLLLDESFRDVMPVLFEFLGVTDPQNPPIRMDPEAKQRNLLAFLRRLTHALSEKQPFVVLIDDLHWIDKASEPFVAAFAEAVAGRRVLFLINFRPEYLSVRLEYHAGWMQKSYYQQLPLLPLGAGASADLLRDLLGSDRSVAGLIDRIWERAGGNPFFTEEIVREQVETGNLEGTRGAYRLRTPAEKLVLPASVQTVLAARIDRLPQRTKQLLQTAAVIGKQFAEPVLRCVERLPEAEIVSTLGALAQAELVYETELYPQAEYSFKHALTQEVAYGSQLGERRRVIHAAVARAIEATYPEKLDERAALLAYHWEQAGEKLTAADWHRRAAEWAGVQDHEAMIRHWARVRTLLAEVPASPQKLALGVIARTHMIQYTYFLGHAGVDARDLFAEGMQLAARVEGAAPRVILLIQYGAERVSNGAMDEGLACLSDGVALADQSEDPFLRFMARCAAAFFFLFAGRLRESVALASEAEALSGGNPDLGAEITGFSPYCAVMGIRGTATALLGRPVDGARVVEQAIEIVRRMRPRDAQGAVQGHKHGCMGVRDTRRRRIRSPARRAVGRYRRGDWEWGLTGVRARHALAVSHLHRSMVRGDRSGRSRPDHLERCPRQRVHGAEPSRVTCPRTSRRGTSRPGRQGCRVRSHPRAGAGRAALPDHRAPRTRSRAARDYWRSGTNTGRDGPARRRRTDRCDRSVRLHAVDQRRACRASTRRRRRSRPPARALRGAPALHGHGGDRPRRSDSEES